MTTNGEKQASPKHPRVTDHIASAKRRRFRRLKSAPLADSFTYDKKTDAVKQCPKSVFDQFSPSYWKIGVVLLVYLAAGTLCFHLTRHQIAGNKTNSVLDALYFTVVTMTSVGYGDVIPDSTLTILLACLFVVLGMLIVGLVLGKAAEVLVVKQERILEKALHLHETIGEAQILKKMKTNTARNKCIILVLLLLVLMGAGTGLLLEVEDLDFVHAFYCVVATLTGLGYIHTCFTTTGSRVFAVFWILLGTVYVAQLLFTFALLYSERKQRSLVKWVLKRKTTTSDLEAADFDGDGVVVAAEFVLYKLKEMGKISQDDITPIVDEFETLDFDKTGTLSVNDLRLSQSALLSGADIVAPRLSV
ncbi:putative EF-hand domain pair, potassium channel domain, EF-Hand 1, calcium-binding protein [Helianthus annuus]|uniref:EF-hand domain pair, potassium channel domain, EF-Hand 1, calcium-binding protein n=1 Tax=Helianthus annuus TaxID=4232 RepID=A0A9K3IIJ6_HELAN|nr:two-pore potassium channel 1-like [Helianthus annuus]XP_035832108.1 two-pore potassium channel 1-like [Helianthus annuus]XP_035832109.1 two-pore potassium channel 1-like [Helianthus annuus]XP_035832110.1 two-pore potassium channel 1-like [Helianthus annuus]KAF5797157.1 putative EF-hand domain pair, potassium channel domain, EF-Hand 1, calcium-binding protein [Helianthus annuus]KAJ0768711.1 putative EF-hand domain pair, potassium channel domain, EF-Hand 1, calcium-binding protein [Helianthus